MNTVATPFSVVILDLAGYIADTPPSDEVIGFVAQLDTSDWEMFGYRVTDNPGGLRVELRLPPLLGQELLLRIPQLPQIMFVAGLNILGGLPAIDVISDESDAENKYLEIRGLRLGIRFDPQWLRPLDQGQPYAELAFVGGLRLYSDWQMRLVSDAGLSLSACEIGNTGIGISLTGLQLDFYTDESPPGVLALGYGNDFRGVYAKEGTLRLLPQSIFGNQQG